MEPILKAALIYWAVVSVGSVMITVLDKMAAKRHMWRISEGTLLLLAALGGAPAMLITMLLIRHKTRHLKFMLGLPLIILLQVVAVIWIVRAL